MNCVPDLIKLNWNLTENFFETGLYQNGIYYHMRSGTWNCLKWALVHHSKKLSKSGYLLFSLITLMWITHVVGWYIVHVTSVE